MFIGMPNKEVISAHIWQDAVSLEPLDKLPSSIGYRVYRHKASGLHLLDTFSINEQQDVPFGSLLPSVDIPLALPENIAVIESIRQALYRTGHAKGLKRSYINFSLMLSALLGTNCLSFATDNSDLDFVCESNSNEVFFISASCFDITITYRGGHTSIAPWHFPGEEPIDIDLDIPRLSPLKVHFSNLDFQPAIPWPYAGETREVITAWKSFTSASPSIIGLGLRKWRFRINAEDFEILKEYRQEGPFLPNELEIRLRAREANLDAQITSRMCPNCGQPCPTYRKTCKHCNFVLGRESI